MRKQKERTAGESGSQGVQSQACESLKPNPHIFILTRDTKKSIPKVAFNFRPGKLTPLFRKVMAKLLLPKGGSND